VQFQVFSTNLITKNADDTSVPKLANKPLKTNLEGLDAQEILILQ